MADQSNKPTHRIVYAQSRGRNQEDILTEIGVEFPHEKGTGGTLVINVPLMLQAGDRLLRFEFKQEGGAQ